jgi:hypothetical protein
MNYLLIGYLLVGGSSFCIFKILNRCVIIDKSKFINIENKIRMDEREKVLNELKIGGE